MELRVGWSTYSDKTATGKYTLLGNSIRVGTEGRRAERQLAPRRAVRLSGGDPGSGSSLHPRELTGGAAMDSRLVGGLD